MPVCLPARLSVVMCSRLCQCILKVSDVVALSRLSKRKVSWCGVVPESRAQNDGATM